MTVARSGFDLVKSAGIEENFIHLTQGGVRWLRSPGLTDYSAALSAMEANVQAISGEHSAECAWLLEHPPLYTAGTSARDEDLLDAGGLPVYRTGRGGQFTYHGPGQRVVYLMLDLSKRGQDVRAFVRGIEAWLADALAELGVSAGCRAGRPGLWVPRPEKGPGREDKIAAIGIRVRRWVSFHGVSINVAPDLARFDGIVPCGIHDQGVTSLAELGCSAQMSDVDAALLATFSRHFGTVAQERPGGFAGFPPQLP
jgi:lipoyl(octanoyl) transferase